VSPPTNPKFYARMGLRRWLLTLIGMPELGLAIAAGGGEMASNKTESNNTSQKQKDWDPPQSLVSAAPHGRGHSIVLVQSTSPTAKDPNSKQKCILPAIVHS
jgi:hypothetical protein